MKYVYLLQSISVPNQRYIGITADLDERLRTHNAGGSPHTSKYRDWCAWINTFGVLSVCCQISSLAPIFIIRKAVKDAEIYDRTVGELQRMERDTIELVRKALAANGEPRAGQYSVGEKCAAYDAGVEGGSTIRFDASVCRTVSIQGKSEI